MKKQNKELIDNNESLNKIYDSANELANEYGEKSVEDFIENTKTKINAKNRATSNNGMLRANEFTNGLIQLILEQQLFDMSDYVGIYNWTNYFDDGYLNEGNSKTYNLSLMGTNKTYDKNEFIPNSTSPLYGEHSIISFFKANGQLSDTSYQYRKSLVLISKEWFQYFMNGNLGKYLSIVLNQARKQYAMFKAYKVQQLIKNISNGNPQVGYANMGENGKDLKALKVTSNANDSYEATIELISILYDMKKDTTKKYCLANDSDNIAPLEENGYLIFAPKEYIATFYSSILSRLPSANLFNNELFTSSTLIPIGRELNDTTNTNQEGVITTQETPFIGANKIFIISKNAIKHIRTLNENANQFYASNLANQNEIHIWGVFGVIPWEKALVFECNNLLVKP